MKKITVVTLAVLLTVSVIAALFSVSAEYSDSDPLVTLSYINETVIPKITEEVKNAVLALVDEKYASKEEVPETPEEPATDVKELDSLKYAVVFLQKGQKLMATGAETSSLEVILRAGNVVAVSPFDDQGIADLTSSKELYNNDPLVKNNYCIIPRGSDGRGIFAENGDAYILVRGEYEIVQ